MPTKDKVNTTTTDTSKEVVTATTDTKAETTNPVLVKLKELGVNDEIAQKVISQLGAETVEHLSGLTEPDLISIGMLALPARNIIAKLNQATAVSEMPMNNMNGLDILPVLPNDEDWLKSFKVGGKLKFSRETVVGTVSAALANKLGLYKIPDIIYDAMEKNAESLEEPVTEDFYDMQRLLQERNYAEIFAAIPGATGRYATKARKNALLEKIDLHLWSALRDFHSTLRSWMESWQIGMNNPGLMVQALTTMVSGGGPSMFASDAMQPPPTNQIRDGAESVINSINKVFAGTGIPVAMALAYDAQQIRKALDNANLPAQIGAVNRDQMLKKLNIAITSDYALLESNLKRYALSIIELPNISSGQTELNYITALIRLGNSIPWEQLVGKSIGTATGIGDSRRDNYGGRRGSDL